MPWPRISVDLLHCGRINLLQRAGALGDHLEERKRLLEDEGVEVVYLSRTPEISTTQIKKDLQK